ncbi:DNA repair protein RadA [Steroidobacter denitrificans]|uniref:DNA repair protein RadA n=1 Tax=Steroidobacter denitrificans TaxID=465721 RepID=A0A127F7L5_STEDE|nr:DNA repair protein RadA [Steroidobacter denitrificans]AMN46397.1 DNA repair protein RadA [Steroidobacter denitrificans]
MAAKTKSREVFVCDQCGNESLQWQGLCPACGAGDALKRVTVARAAPPHRALTAGSGEPRLLSQVAEQDEPRIPTGLAELDRVLGGGLVLGSVTLLGGDPGIGKSTLLLQAGDTLSRATPTLYVTGEESLRQVSLRARRLEVSGERLQLLAETSVETLLEQAVQSGARVLVIDSIQTMFAANVESSPGSASQVRESAAALVRFAKASGVSVLIIGHVTKEGIIAGPRILEHMVDTVLYFESDAGSRYRLVRAVKNRFGAANEVGVFAMTEQGLKEVKNPSAIFLSQHAQPVAGSSVMVAREGSRPMLIEVQALTDESQGMNPRRVAVGLEANRLALLLAVLHRHGGISTAGRDVFLNVVGGVRISETAADLPAVLATVSSARDKPLAGRIVCFGELGLAGEVRPVPYGEERLREAAKHGFERAIVPVANVPRRPIEGLEIIGVERLTEALHGAF